MVKKMGSQVEKIVEHFRNIEQRENASPSRSSHSSEKQPMLKNHQPSSPGDLEMADISSSAGGVNGARGGGNGAGNGPGSAATGNGGAGNGNGKGGAGNGNGGGPKEDEKNGPKDGENGPKDEDIDRPELEGRPGTWTLVRGKLRTFGSKISKCFKRDAPPAGDPPQGHGQAISTGKKDWAERVDKALDNPMNKSRLAYFASMTIFLPILLARPLVLTDPTTGDPSKESTPTSYYIEMAIEMCGAFFIHTICFYNVLSYHTVQTTAPRLTRWYERSNTLMWWSLSTGWMAVYTAHIPQYVKGWWQWVILAFYLGVILAITIRVGCLGQVTEEGMIHRSEKWV